MPTKPTNAKTNMNPIRLLLVDPHRLLLDAWAHFFTSVKGFDIIGKATGVSQALHFLTGNDADVVMMEMPADPAQGLDDIRQLRAGYDRAALVALSPYHTVAYAKSILQAGARAFVTKNSPQEELLEALHMVHAGQKYVCREIKDRLTQEQLSGEDPFIPLLQTLSKREKQVVTMVRQGLSSREIAQLLQVSAKTIEVHRYRILQKTGMPNTAALVHLFSSRGW